MIGQIEQTGSYLFPYRESTQNGGEEDESDER